MPLALIVLGNRVEAEQLAALLRQAGLRAEWHPDTGRALERSSEEVPELVVVDTRDHAGAGANGDHPRVLRSHPPLGATPLVCLGDRPGHKALRIGPRFDVHHPWTPAAVLEAVHKARGWRADLGRARQLAEVELEFPSVPQYLFEATELLTDVLGATTMAHDQVRQMRQAILEMGQNAIEWGNRLDPNKRVRVLYKGYPDRVEIVVRDEGPGFDPKHLPHAATADDPIAHLDVRQEQGLRDGGFGLLIVRGMVDELTYNDPGNEVTLVRRLPPAKSHAHATHKVGSP
jgi:anti-sigma regulatory factor (Ser/Thr protein kinase)